MVANHTETAAVQCPNCRAVNRYRVVSVTPGGESYECAECGTGFTDAARGVVDGARR